MPRFPENIELSEKYTDGVYEYRHVILPKELYHIVRQKGNRLLLETEWRNLGIQQSKGWQHYATYACEPHILHFRRSLGTNPKTGHVSDPAIYTKIKDYEKVQKDNLDYEVNFNGDYDI